MRLTALITLSILAILATGGCESSTEPERPKLKTGASAELAIELPLVFPPAPKRANVVTEWWVIQGRELWFRNASEDPIRLEMIVTNPFTSESNSVSVFELPAFTTNFMRLNKDYTTNDYRYFSWALKYRQGYQVETIGVGFAP